MRYANGGERRILGHALRPDLRRGSTWTGEPLLVVYKVDSYVFHVLILVLVDQMISRILKNLRWHKDARLVGVPGTPRAVRAVLRRGKVGSRKMFVEPDRNHGCPTTRLLLRHELHSFFDAL